MARGARTLSRLAAVGGVLAGAVAVLVPLSSASAEDQQVAPPRSCEVHRLPMPAGFSDGSVTGASPDGRTLLGQVRSPQRTNIVIWRDGKIVDTIENQPNPMVDMNGNGVGVGGFFDKWGDDRPFVYADGKLRVLPGDVQPQGINDSGRMVGSRTATPEDGHGGSVPVTWAADADRPVDLPAAESGSAHDISADGTTVGEVGRNAYVWRPDGTSGPLPRPEGTGADDKLIAYEINGPWVVGEGPEGLVRWNLETGRAEALGDVYAAGHTGINELGWVVASIKSGNQAVMLAGGKTIPLPGLGQYVHYADSITADGTMVAGTAVIPKGTSTPISWICS